MGSAALDQWRPCSERYHPYPNNQEDARYWPVSYLHPAPPPNGTATPPPSPPRGGYATSTARPKDLEYPAVPRHRPGSTPDDDDDRRWMPSVPSRTSKFILDHPEYYNYYGG